MKIVNKKLTLKEFKDYVAKKDFGSKPPTFLVIHHTFKPTQDTWNGQKTIDALKRYYEGLGWSAGPHIFIAPDGIWLFTDMYDVGIHAGAGNGSLATGYSIGIEVVGNYDGAKWSGIIKEQTLGVIHTLINRLNIPKSRIKRHNDYSAKTCPGKMITKDYILAELLKYEDSITPQIEPIPVIPDLAPTSQEPMQETPKPMQKEDYIKPTYQVKQLVEDLINLFKIIIAKIWKKR